MREKFFIKTFGCKINQYDSAVLRGYFLSIGMEEAGSIEEADHIVLNSCVVTHKAERDARHFLNRIKRRKKPQAKVYFTGCGAGYMEVGGDFFVGDFNSLKKFLGIDGVLPEFSRSRPFVKVQEGCNFKCTYCVVPRVRGQSRSRPIDDILKEVRYHLENGSKEIVLTGTQIGDWGKEWGFHLEDLLERILDIGGDFRVRISSISPIHVTDRLVDLFQNPGMAPHFHISLQSGSPEILKRMKRPYTVRRYVETVRKIHDLIEGVAIGTDIIVGFPGEREEDFRKTVKLVEELPFAYVHVFEYSPRPGTEAYVYGDLPHTIKKERVHRLLEVVEKKRENFKRQNVGRKLRILVEGVKNGLYVGTSGNYLRVLVKEERLEVGSFTDVIVKSPLPGDRDVEGVVLTGNEEDFPEPFPVPDEVNAGAGSAG